MLCIVHKQVVYPDPVFIERGGGVIQRWNNFSFISNAECNSLLILCHSTIFICIFFFFLDCRNSMHSGFQQESWVWDHISKSPEVLLSKDKHSAYFYIDPIYESTGTAGRHKIRIFIILCKLYISCRRHKQQCKLMQHRVVLSSLGISSVKLSAMM